MHKMRTTAIDDPGRLLVTRHCCANTAEQNKVLLGMQNLGNPRNIAIDENPHFLHEFNVALPNYSGHLT